MKIIYLLLLSTLLTCLSCRNDVREKTASSIAPEDSSITATPQEKQNTQPPEITPSISYLIAKKKDWQAQKDSFAGAKHLDILTVLNRVDSAHIRNLDSILVPDNFDYPLSAYMPFPEKVDFLKDIHKIIIFSIPTQAFGAYQNGELVRTGATNSGRKTKPTPPNLYFANWKAKKSISTVSDEWVLKWNFNVANKMGIGFHQYALPGYPASHSCMRLQESDAQFLYSFGEQWILKDNQQLLANGTPVVVLGKYPFGQPRPWYQMAKDPDALKISVDSLQNWLSPYMGKIINAQQVRDSVIANM